MARLPEPGGDAGDWGEILNDFLRQEHHDDGVLKDVARSSDIAAIRSRLDVAHNSDGTLKEHAIAAVGDQRYGKPISRITRGNRTVVAIGDSITSTGYLHRNYVNHAQMYADGIVDIGARFAA